VSSFLLGPGVVHDRSCGDREFLAEVPVERIGKKFGGPILMLFICLQRLIPLNLCSQVSQQMRDA